MAENLQRKEKERIQIALFTMAKDKQETNFYKEVNSVTGR